MAARLSPEEAARRRAERAQATWSGATYRRYDRQTEGRGHHAQWRGAADALAAGRIEQPKPAFADLDVLGLTSMPATAKALRSAWRAAAMRLRNLFGSDTAVGYAEAFRTLTAAHDRLAARCNQAGSSGRT